MHKRLLILLPLAALLLAGALTGYRLLDGPSRPLRPLDPALVYDPAEVTEFLFELEEAPNADSLRRAAEGFYRQGIEAIVKRRNDPEGIRLLVQSSRHNPKADTYLKLTFSLLQSDSVAEALKAIQVCEALQGEDLNGEAAFVHARALAKLPNDPNNPWESNIYEIYRLLIDSRRAGFLSPEKLKDDPAFAWVLADGWFQDNADNLFSDAGAASTRAHRFRKLAALFAPVPASGLSYGPDKIRESFWMPQELKKMYSEFIPEMENSYFGRMTSNTYTPIASSQTPEGYTALVYANIGPFGSGFRETYFNLLTFNADGDILDRRVIGSYTNPERLKCFEIRNGLVRVREYTLKWEKPYAETPPANNRVVDRLPGPETAYQITRTGKILPIASAN